MVAFADDFSAAGKLKSLLQWWTALLKIGPKFGYFPWPTKLWLITKFKTQVLEKELWQKVSRVSFRYSHIQEKVR